MICPFSLCRLSFPNATQLQRHRGKVHRWIHAPKDFSPQKWEKIIEEEVRKEEGGITDIFSERVVNNVREYLCVAENENLMWRAVGNRCKALVRWKKVTKKTKFAVPLIKDTEQRKWHAARLSVEDKRTKKEISQDRKKIHKKKYGKKK